MGEYANPEVLCETEWVESVLDDPGVRIVEVDVDTLAYEEGHIPGAVGWDWRTELCDQTTRDILSKADFEALMRRSGITPSTTVVLYGDNHNWFAAWAFWQMKMFGHDDVRLMNGGRDKWLEEGRLLSLDRPRYDEVGYVAKACDDSSRAFLDELRQEVEDRSVHLVDVRSLAEFTGDLLAPPGLPETCQRGGHIPGAVSVPWGIVCRDDGTFLDRDALEELFRSRSIDGTRKIVVYCRIGERSSHTWFVLRYLLGYTSVQNYDGSWTEWGNLVRAPVERGER